MVRNAGTNAQHQPYSPNERAKFLESSFFSGFGTLQAARVVKARSSHPEAHIPRFPPANMCTASPARRVARIAASSALSQSISGGRGARFPLRRAITTSTQRVRCNVSGRPQPPSPPQAPPSSGGSGSSGGSSSSKGFTLRANTRMAVFGAGLAVFGAASLCVHLCALCVSCCHHSPTHWVCMRPQILGDVWDVVAAPSRGTAPTAV